jgi:glucuronosyltransferase
MNSFLKLISLLSIVSIGNAANILYLHGILSPSHHLWNSVLARELAIRGHNVTFLSTNPPKGETKNVHYVVLEKSYEILDELISSEHNNMDMVQYVAEVNRNKFASATGLVDYAVKTCKAVMASSNGLNIILDYPDDFGFDLVVYDFTCGPCLLPVVQKFKNPPVVGVSAFLNPPYTDFVIGGHKHPAYIPHYILDFPQIMSLYQRTFNLLIYTVEKL